ncbi:hypothetical protein CFC21_084736 [Triticum aestivum]|uniref:Uncharacterized protein n=3 Tax=Triticum TaxID=4564 RepID=A0A3B6NUT5_WHEAT|nr:uncharacterized protein LOC119318093 [Triticum dicoccoides]XP_044404559.1 uncharacterized protein LOC123128584 [Triticum aestivum]XP_048536185.1 uncharacterized protein LOC125514862 [Triticum urartu]KAF7080703.1 hypothetical protein CFC21_084736 [Triticum aestivum]
MEEERKGFQPHLMGLGGGSRLRGAAGAMGLQKQNSWSPDIERDEAWERRRRGILGRGRRSPLQRAQSVTDDQLDELRGSLDLGFRFDPPSQRCAACDAGRSRLVETLPALDLLYAVAANANAGGCAGAASHQCSCGASSEASEPSPIGSPLSILSPDDPPETVKMRLKQWAQVVALSMRSRS